MGLLWQVWSFLEGKNPLFCVMNLMPEAIKVLEFTMPWNNKIQTD
jgi:hypothetical protein